MRFINHFANFEEREGQTRKDGYQNEYCHRRSAFCVFSHDVWLQHAYSLLDLVELERRNYVTTILNLQQEGLGGRRSLSLFELAL